MKPVFTLIIFISSVVSYSAKTTDDVPEFVKFRCGLYKNKSGDVGFKTSFLLDDLGTRATRFQTRGYLLDDEDIISNNSEIVELKKVVDTSSFEILNDYFCKDNKHVYAIFYTSDGATINITGKIDSESFRVFYNSS